MSEPFFELYAGSSFVEPALNRLIVNSATFRALIKTNKLDVGAITITYDAFGTNQSFTINGIRPAELTAADFEFV